MTWPAYSLREDVERCFDRFEYQYPSQELTVTGTLKQFEQFVAFRSASISARRRMVRWEKWRRRLRRRGVRVPKWMVP